MRQIVGIIMVVFASMWLFRACVPGPRRVQRQPVYEQNATVASQDAADGLDLQAVLEMTKTVKSAKELERKLNKSGGVNNLDLNDDGEVDFIKVTEFGSKEDEAWGFSLTTEPVKGEEQEVATIEIEKTGEQEAQVQVRGNEHIYGHDHYYHNRFGFGDFLLMSYLLRPHPFYISPFYYGYYPTYYSRYAPVSRTRYRSSMRNYTSGSRAKRTNSSRMTKASSLRNPKAGKTANKGIRKSLANPTSTQKQFQARNRPAVKRSGGFGRSSTRRSPGSRSPARRSGGFGRSTARSVRSFGGGGFGGGGK